MKIVLCDDEEKVCRLVAQLIPWDELGLSLVGMAHNGLEALELVERESPDLVITDIRMPGMDGLELIKRIRERGDPPACVIISGYDHFEYAHNAIRYGVEDYLLKPIKEAELASVLRRLLARHERRLGERDAELSTRRRLEESLVRLRRGFLSAMALEKGHGPVPGLDWLNRNHGYSLADGYCQVCVVKLDCEPDVFSEELVRLLADHVRADFSEELGGLCHDLEAASYGSRVAVLLNYPELAAEEARRAIKRAGDRLQARRAGLGRVELALGAGPRIACSSGACDLAASLAGAEEAVACRLLGRQGAFLAPPQAQARPSAQAVLADWSKALSRACALGQPEEAEAAATVLRREARELAGDSAAFELELLKEAARRLGGLAEEQLGRGLGREGESECLGGLRERLARLETELDLAGSFDAAYGRLAEASRDALRLVIEEKARQLSRPIREAKRYLAERYQDPSVTLESAAEAIGYNPSYISELFKRETGRGFLDYLTDMRIDRAKELLRETPDTVARIALRVGYGDTKYFAKVFSKRAGIKPSDYRRLYG